jgi:glycosyltransferase involved in cell wall biosynthesis
MIADTAEEFALAVIHLLGDPDESVRLGQNGRALVERRYNWQTIGARLRDVLDGAVRAHETAAVTR